MIYKSLIVQVAVAYYLGYMEAQWLVGFKEPATLPLGTPADRYRWPVRLVFDWLDADQVANMDKSVLNAYQAAVYMLLQIVIIHHGPYLEHERFGFQDAFVGFCPLEKLNTTLWIQNKLPCQTGESELTEMYDIQYAISRPRSSLEIPVTYIKVIQTKEILPCYSYFTELVDSLIIDRGYGSFCNSDPTQRNPWPTSFNYGYIDKAERDDYRLCDCQKSIIKK